MTNIDTKATFSLQGEFGTAQVRFVLMDGWRQMAQLRLGEDWIELPHTEPYTQVYELLAGFQRTGMNTYVHMTAKGPAGRITRMIDGRENRLWVDRCPPESSEVTWRQATPAESQEMDDVQARIAALTGGDPVFWWLDCAQTGNSGWESGIYHCKTQWGHSIQEAGPYNINGPARNVSHIMTMEDARRMGYPGALAAAA